MSYTDTGTPSSGNGSVLQLSDDASPPNYSTVALIAGDITGFGVSSSVLETTHQNNPDGHKTRILGLKDPGSLPLKVFWDEDDETLNGATADGLWSLAQSQTFRNWRILGGRDEDTSEHWLVRGAVSKMMFGLPLDGIKNADIELTLSGRMHHSSEV